MLTQDCDAVETNYTNRHKDVIAQREFSASETMQRMKGIVLYFQVRLHAIRSAKTRPLGAFWLSTSSLNNFPIEPTII